MLHPHGRVCFTWESFGGALIIWDLFMAPMQVFRMPITKLVTSLEWVTACYWSCDLILRFLVGYEESGSLVLKWRKVAKHYVCTWGLLDMVAVIMDWVSISQGSSMALHASRSWHLGRAARAVCITARLAKVVRLLRTSIDSIYTEEMLLMAKVCYTLVTVLLTAHYIACYWYYLGREGWLLQSGFDPTDLWYLYTSSFEWSLGRLGLTSTDLHPTSLQERLYAAGATLLGLLVIPAITSSFTLWMMQVREADYDRVMQLAQVRKYLKIHGVSLHLTNRVVHFFRQHYSATTKPIQEHEVRFLCNLPKVVQARIHAEVYMPLLKQHPAFERFCSLSREGSMAVCHVAMEGQHCVAGQELFVKGDEAESMFVLGTGLLHYYPKYGCVPVAVESGYGVCEVVLWRDWRHCGQLVAARSSEVVLVNAKKFRSLLDKGEERGWPVAPLRNYARLALVSCMGPCGHAELWSGGDVGRLAEEAFAPWTREPHRSRLRRMLTPLWSVSEGSMTRGQS